MVPSEVAAAALRRSAIRSLSAGRIKIVPLAARRTAFASSVLSPTCLSTYPDAPPRTVARAARSSSYPDRRRHVTGSVLERRARHTSMPVPSGSRSSKTAISGCRSAADRMASAAELPSPTISNPSSSNNSRSPCRTSSWSVTMNTRMGAAEACSPPLGAAGVSITYFLDRGPDGRTLQRSARVESGFAAIITGLSPTAAVPKVRVKLHRSGNHRRS